MTSSSDITTLSFRDGVPADFYALAELWRRSVTATHHFLTPEDIGRLYVEVRDVYLAHVELCIAEANGVAVGFMGLNPDRTGDDPCKVEMLFVDPNQRGKGIGSALLHWARDMYGKLTVDVNEQNPAALAFYLQQGFHVTGRSPLDGQGKPFPLLHLSE